MKFLKNIAFILGLFGASAALAQQPTQAPGLQYFEGPSIGMRWEAANALTAGINAQTGTTYTVLGTDAGKLVTLSNAAAVAVTLPQAGTTGFEVNKTFNLTNAGASLVTITPTTSTIQGLSTVVLGPGRSIQLISDGTNYQIPAGAVDGTACSASGATPQTCNGNQGQVTTNSLTVAGASVGSYAINNTAVSATSNVQCTMLAYSGTFTTNGLPSILSCSPAAGSITVIIGNVHASAALSGTVKIGFRVIN